MEHSTKKLVGSAMGWDRHLPGLPVIPTLRQSEVVPQTLLGRFHGHLSMGDATRDSNLLADRGLGLVRAVCGQPWIEAANPCIHRKGTHITTLLRTGDYSFLQLSLVHQALVLALLSKIDLKGQRPANMVVVCDYRHCPHLGSFHRRHSLQMPSGRHCDYQ